MIFSKKKKETSDQERYKAMERTFELADDDRFPETIFVESDAFSAQLTQNHQHSFRTGAELSNKRNGRTSKRGV